jgi:hypothetical protein
MSATFLDLEDENEDEKIRSRWSCSTVATLAPPTAGTPSPSSPTFAAASARLRLHLASVARRVRIRRAGWSSNNNGSGERTASIHSAEGTLHVRSSSEPDKLWFEVWGGSLLSFRRGPISFELFSRWQKTREDNYSFNLDFGPLLFFSPPTNNDDNNQHSFHSGLWRLFSSFHCFLLAFHSPPLIFNLYYKEKVLLNFTPISFLYYVATT